MSNDQKLSTFLIFEQKHNAPKSVPKNFDVVCALYLKEILSVVFISFTASQKKIQPLIT